MKSDEGHQGSFNFLAETEGLDTIAQRALKHAESLARIGDPGAGEAFKDAKLLAIKSPSPELQMRAHYGHGEWLKSCGDFTEARNCFSTAEKNAWLIDQDSEEKVARIRLAIIEVDIEAGRDEELKACFKNFKTATKSCSNLWDERHGVWVEFTEKADYSGERLAARKRGSEEYFRSRLEAAKQRRREVR